MALSAAVLAILAVIAFIYAAVPHTRQPPSRLARYQWVPIGLALLTVALICQFVVIGGWHWTLR